MTDKAFVQIPGTLKSDPFVISAKKARLWYRRWSQYRRGFLVYISGPFLRIGISVVQFVVALP